jgi:hypothetical protein
MKLYSLIEGNSNIDLSVDKLQFKSLSQDTDRDNIKPTDILLEYYSSVLNSLDDKDYIANKNQFLLQRNLYPDFYLKNSYIEQTPEYSGYLYKLDDLIGITLKLLIPPAITDIIGFKDNIPRWKIEFDLLSSQEWSYPSIISLYSGSLGSSIDYSNLTVHLQGNHKYFIANSIPDTQKRTIYSKDLLDINLLESIPRIVVIKDFIITDNFNIYSIGDVV